MLNLRRRLALFGHLYDFGEIFPARRVLLDMLAARIPGRVGGKHSFLIYGIRQRRHDTICCKQDGAVESRKLFTLLPPGITVVAHKMRVLLKGGIIMRRQHLAVCIYIHARTFRLFQQFFQVFQVMSANQDARTVLDTDIHFGDFGISISSRIRLVQQRHGLYPETAGFEHQLRPFVRRKRAAGYRSQRVLHKDMNIIVVEAQTHGMFQIGRHTFQTVRQQFFQRTEILVGFTQHAYRLRLFRVIGACSLPGEFVHFRQKYIVTLGFIHQAVAQGKPLVHPLQDAFIIEIGIRNRGEQGIHHKYIGLSGHGASGFTQGIGNYRNASDHKQQQIHGLRRMAFFSAHTFQHTAYSFSCFLALITKHVHFHFLIHLEVYTYFLSTLSPSFGFL